MKINILYVVPHLSTGGMPQFVLKRIQSLPNNFNVKLVEYSFFGDQYVVQRNKIIDLIGKNNFHSLGTSDQIEKKYKLIDIIKENQIDVVHIEEISEGFESFNQIPISILNELYDNKRTWKIVETCHNIWFDSKNRKFHPDSYLFVTPYHIKTFELEKVYKEVLQYPIENKKPSILKKIQTKEKLNFDLKKIHVLNVGLWTQGKNQKEGIEVARFLEKTHLYLHFHFVGNQAKNFKSYWEPTMNDLPTNVTIWKERNDVELFMIASDFFMFNSTWECNPLVLKESISYGLKILARDLPQYCDMYKNYIKLIESDKISDISNNLLDLINSNFNYDVCYDYEFSNQLSDFYFKVMGLDFTKNNKVIKDIKINRHFVLNPFIEILSKDSSLYEVNFYDQNDNLTYFNKIKNNSWVKLYRQYYTKWKTEIKENGQVIFFDDLNLENKRVYISFESKSLGDTLAWIPYCEEFRKKHNCKLIVSTFLNDLFVDHYSEIEFVKPGSSVSDVFCRYQLGWFYNQNNEFDLNKHPHDFKLQPLQKTATDILGLEYEEIKPRLNLPIIPKKKKVGIGFHSTAQAKYWNNPNGWQGVVDYLTSQGYECMIYSKEGNGYMGNNYPKGVTLFSGGNLEQVINDLLSCEFFIGLGSGLSWLAWACKLPVVLISGFSEKFVETKLDTYRVINENVCHGCFNKERLNAGDWNWCPLHKGTEKMFECSKQITSEMVIKEINKIMNKEKNTFRVDEVLFDWGKKSEWYVSQATKEIFEYNIYERLFEVEEGDIVVDLGASLGPFTYSILSKNPKECFVVEPLTYHVDILKKNLNRNNVKIIQGAISDKKKLEITWDGITEISPTFTFEEFVFENNIKKIDFLKCDCEGGEYDVFSKGNIEFLKTIPKIVVEFHLRDNEDYHQCKFRWFRDNILNNFENFEVYSLDGVDIKWNLWNEHFIEYYNEVIIYIDNK